MVRLINQKNAKHIANLVYSIMHLQEFFTHIKNINEPKTSPCIYVMWHQNQFCVYGIEDKKHLNIQVSTSLDGEIITHVVKKMGFNAVRGSAARRGAVQSTMQMITKLKEGESVAIMVDGPRGPIHKVKNGAIVLAEKTGVPIVPVYWYSPQKNFMSLPSWDKIKMPFGHCNIIDLFGDPIYVKPDVTDEEMKAIATKIENELFALEEKAPKIYKEAVKNKLWKH